MSTATIELYRTESGSVYEIAGQHVRRTTADGEVAEDWAPYRSISRIPAGALRPGQRGEVLEVVLTSGRRIFTSRLVAPVDDR